jgi:hypothetical protein
MGPLCLKLTVRILTNALQFTQTWGLLRSQSDGIIRIPVVLARLRVTPKRCRVKHGTSRHAVLLQEHGWGLWCVEVRR